MVDGQFISVASASKAIVNGGGGSGGGNSKL